MKVKKKNQMKQIHFMWKEIKVQQQPQHVLYVWKKSVTKKQNNSFCVTTLIPNDDPLTA